MKKTLFLFLLALVTLCSQAQTNRFRDSTVFFNSVNLATQGKSLYYKNGAVPGYVLAAADTFGKAQWVKNVNVDTSFSFTTSDSIKLVADDNWMGFGFPFCGSYKLDTNNITSFAGTRRLGTGYYTSVLSTFNLNTFEESVVSTNYFSSLNKQGVLLKSKGATGTDFVGITLFDAVQVHAIDNTDTLAFSVTSWNGSDIPNFQVWRNGINTFGSNDSATIYSKTPPEGSIVFCSDCSGNGITGRILAFIGAAWRRLTFE